MDKNTVAFLTRSLVDATGSNLWYGIITKCKNANVPLITFRGPILNKGTGSIIYHLITDDSFIGVISWASSDVDQKAVDYYQKYKQTPLICMTFRIPGHPVIIADCKSGLLELVDHLVNVHHFTKIAFIRGPEKHVYAKERYEAYIEGLKKHGIEVDKRLISPCGDWSINAGAKAINDWLSQGLKPTKDIEAVIAVGDNVAIGAQEELIRKGFAVPQDIAVCGFNGTNDASCCNPPLTTVQMPFYGIGTKSFSILSSILNNKDFPSEFRYGTKLIIAESCGCTSASVQLAAHSDEALNQNNTARGKKSPLAIKSLDEIKKTLNSPDWQEETIDSLSEAIEQNRYATEPIKEFFANWTPKILAGLTRELSGSKKDDESFISDITRSLNKYIAVAKEFSVWQDVISVLRSKTLSAIGRGPQQIKAENIFQQARILISEIDIRTQKQTNLLESRKESILRNVSTSLLSCSDMTQLMNLIATSLPKLGISGCYVALYNNCEYTEENHKIPETSRMILAIHNGERIPLPVDGLTFNTTELIPDRVVTGGGFNSYVLESLHYQDTYLGYIIFETQMVNNGVIYAALRDQISSSLYGAIIVAEREKARVKLEATMSTMTSKADIVSNQSEGISDNIATASQSMESVAESIRTISGNISTVARTVESANKMISDADVAIDTVVQSTKKISNAIKMINDIAEKTNVLALNAAIEAAHAGDAGRGFSVVAKEVKSLAAQTVNSTRTIEELVEKNNHNTKQTEKIIDSTNAAIKTIADLSEKIKRSINEQVNTSTAISTQLKNASTGVEEISSAITEIAKLGENLDS